MNATVRKREVIPLMDEDALLRPDAKRVRHRSVAKLTRVMHCLLVTRLIRIKDRVARIASAELTSAWVATSNAAIGVHKGHMAKTAAFKVYLNLWQSTTTTGRAGRGRSSVNGLGINLGLLRNRNRIIKNDVGGSSRGLKER